MDEKPPLKMEVGDWQFVAVDYWWEGRDFHVVTDAGESYCFGNMYPMSLSFDGLESADDLTVVGSSVKYIPSSS